jgi:alkanesulfonate monooxygenase SsuD/methylene tetrahydromethanopterin reductase-like flavin-dependent oxidoreductase (luciferase family)
MQTHDLPLLKLLKTATVAPAPLAIWCTLDKNVFGKVRSMELGIYHEFPVLPGRSQAECFAAGFDIVDASEEYGLDVMWLAELHFDKRRALAASPLVLGTAIAARTERIRIGTSVQVLPLANPLRIAEEAATLDHVSQGRLIFGVGRSGVVKTYEALNIAYSESKDREVECLEIIQRAWREDNFSYKGKFYDIQDVTVVPQPVQQPMPEIRVAAVSVETFPAAGKAGQGLFLSVRHEDVRMFKQHIDVYRKAWTDAGHPGEAPVYLRCPGFVAKTDAAAQEAYGPTLMQHFQNQSRLLADSSRRQNSPPDHPRWKTSQRLTEITLEETLRGSVFIGSPDTVVGKLIDLQRDIGLSGVQLETNCAGLADHAEEREAIRLLAREVKSAFH